ncbi:NAD-binding 3-hydroxyacyl-CoA dehydrogenase [Nitzschia inconspicua]|uniref:NAD-binding 3-hydroxyacyl-CoA dehydrogenase n=1 Tax=Nitzschia inconspicua TaxID=303405 RepID=A0A9K3PZ03_9STRA|nr:NAD-binding 3-hydroxyacyl-CoA dehydrogenase [Nitzschia inconspicua]
MPSFTPKSVLVLDFSTVTTNPLNPLGLSLRRFIWQSLENAEQDDSIGSIILYGGPKNFSAGADLTEFSSLEKQSSTASTGFDQTFPLIELVGKIENFSKPIVAAISGNALGGGLEVALSCHYRVSTLNSQFGLPEVHVGVIPGAGGTQRLPRVVGVAKALEMILTGVPIDAKDAKEHRLIDHVVLNDESLLEVAQKYAEWAQLMPLADRRVGQQQIRESTQELQTIFEFAAKKLPPASMGGEGVRSAFEAVKACSRPIADGSTVELQQFFKTLSGDQGKARRHGFFAIRKAQKPVGKPPKNHPLLQKDVSKVKVAVVGAGLMGSGICMVLLKAGFQVHLVDLYKASLDKGVAFLNGTIQSYVQRGKMTEAKAQTLLEALKPSQRLEDLSSCSLVVEAVIEDMKIKKKIFLSLDKITPPSCILLSNTSTLDIDEMASAVSHSRRPLFAGWHFFSPAHVMKLVEIVLGDATSLETTCIMQQLTKRIGKIGVVVGNCDGFVGNRLLIPYGAETTLLLEEGVATVPAVDKAFLKFGIALGPFQMADLAGLDIGYNIRKQRGWVSSNGTPAKNKPSRYPDLADVIVSEYKRLGQKTGKGWYDYDESVGKGRKPLTSKEVDQLVQKYAIKGQRQFSEQEMIERVLFPLVNEGFKCLEEGIAKQPSDIDVIYLHGYGWPVYRGGPMWWADNEVGLTYLLKRLEDFSAQFPETPYYVPSELLKKCVTLGVTVEDYFNLGLFQGQVGIRSKL